LSKRAFLGCCFLFLFLACGGAVYFLSAWESQAIEPQPKSTIPSAATKLIASDGKKGMQLGYSVSQSEDTVVL
jgi:FG-GAP repeat